MKKYKNEKIREEILEPLYSRNDKRIFNYYIYQWPEEQYFNIAYRNKKKTPKNLYKYNPKYL